MAICKKCKTLNHSDANYCKECGQSLATLSFKEKLINLWTNQKKWLYSIIGSLIILTILIIIIVNHKQEKEYQYRRAYNAYENLIQELTVEKINAYFENCSDETFFSRLKNILEEAINPDFAKDSGYFADRMDGKIYKWVKIKNQIWMAEDFKDYYTDVPNSLPEGWKVPSIDDWRELITNVVGADSSNWSVYGKYLKSKSGWDVLGNGTDNFGFSVYPNGVEYNEDIENKGKLAAFLTSTKINGNFIKIVFKYNTDVADACSDCFTYNRFKLRLIKKE